MRERLPDNSVDLILTDPPYGTLPSKKNSWDVIIPVKEMFTEFNRVLKEYGTIVLFSKQPFTSKLVMGNYDNFKYSLVWKKNRVSDFVFAPYKIMCEHEDLLVFSKAGFAGRSRHKMTYNPQDTMKCTKKQFARKGNSYCTNIKSQPGWVQTTTNYPRSVLEFKSIYGRFHPAQKPLDLVTYLVKTFSNEGDTILDACTGSGTTAVACLESGNRKFIGFETNKKYYDYSLQRVASYTKTGSSV